MKKNDRIRLQMRLMRLIKRFSINGIVCNIENHADNTGRSYADAVETALKVVIDWADATAFAGRIAYFLEAGARGQGLAETNLGEIARDPARAAAHRYAGHAFVPKAGNPGVQAADLLAWQYHNFTKKRAEASVARLDLRALLRHPHSISDACGEVPRNSRTQSVEESRSRIETVFYLPRVPQSQTKGRSVLVIGKDSATISSDVSQVILACPNCWRAVCEYPLGNIQDIVFRCWCGTYVDTPAILAPFAARFSAETPLEAHLARMRARAPRQRF